MKEDSIGKEIVSRLEDIGEARCLIDILIEDLKIQDLSKHNTYWHSEHELEAEKLHDIRLRNQFIEEKLFDIWSLLSTHKDDRC